MTTWAGRVGGGGLHPAVWEFLRADDAELLPYDCEATAIHARRLQQAGILGEAELEDVILTKDEARLKRPLEQRWTELVYEGLWFHPAREAIDAFVAKTQELVSGEVRVELRPNAAVVTGRRSPNLLYAEQLASYATGETFPHEAAEGFIRISALETELLAARARAKAEA